LGLVERQRSKEDERVVTIKLTKKGIELEEPVAKIQEKVVCKTHLLQKDFNALKSTLNELTDTMEVNEVDRQDLKLKYCK